MEVIKIENRIYTEGSTYDIQTVQLMMNGASVHVQIMKNKHTGELKTPSVDVFSHSPFNNKFPTDFEVKIFTESKMTKKSRKVGRSGFQVIDIAVKEESQ